MLANYLCTRYNSAPFVHMVSAKRAKARSSPFISPGPVVVAIKTKRNYQCIIHVDCDSFEWVQCRATSVIIAGDPLNVSGGNTWFPLWCTNFSLELIVAGKCCAALPSKRAIVSLLWRKSYFLVRCQAFEVCIYCCAPLADHELCVSVGAEQPLWKTSNCRKCRSFRKNLELSKMSISLKKPRTVEKVNLFEKKPELFQTMKHRTMKINENPNIRQWKNLELPKKSISLKRTLNCRKCNIRQWNLERKLIINRHVDMLVDLGDSQSLKNSQSLK